MTRDAGRKHLHSSNILFFFLFSPPSLYASLHSHGGRRKSAHTYTNTHARILHQRDKKLVQLMATDAVNTTSVKAGDRGTFARIQRVEEKKTKNKGGGGGGMCVSITRNNCVNMQI